MHRKINYIELLYRKQYNEFIFIISKKNKNFIKIKNSIYTDCNNFET